MYSDEEVEALVEGYDELVNKRHKLFILVRLLDLELTLRKLSKPHRQAVLLCGMVGLTTRSAGRLAGVSATTMHKRYHRGLRDIVNLLNTGAK